MSLGIQAGNSIPGLSGVIDSTQPYVYLSTSFDTTFGNEGSLMVAISPLEPAIYIKGDGIFPSTDPLSLSKAAVGLAGSPVFTISPTSTWHYDPTSPVLTAIRFPSQFRGKVLVEGTVDIGLDDAFSVEIAASGVADVQYAEMFNLSGNPFDSAALTGTATFVAEVFIIPFECELGGATVEFSKTKGSYGKTVAVSGYKSDINGCTFGPLSTRALNNLGFMASGGFSLYTHYVENYNGRKHVMVRGQGSSSINGYGLESVFFEYDSFVNAMTFRAKVNFGVSKINVYGQFGENNFRLDAESTFGKNYQKRVAGIKIKIGFEGTVETKFTESGFEYTSKAKMCIKKCGSVSSSVIIEDGKLKVCAKLDHVGKKCVAIDTE